MAKQKVKSPWIGSLFFLVQVFEKGICSIIERELTGVTDDGASFELWIIFCVCVWQYEK